MSNILVFATNNAHKAREVEGILEGRFQIKSLKEIGCTEDIEETENKLEGNALLKARYVFSNFQLNCFSEDTGLEVAALDGAPGVHTARYAGEQRDPDDNISLLLENLKDKTDRSAQFRTVIALIEDGETVLFEGVCRGRIATEKHGVGGFGYDPVFIPEGYDLTFAQLGESVKNKISHRAQAVAKLLAYLRER